MNEVVQTAVTDVKPSGRGKKPIILKGGKPLKEARTEAAAGIKAAKLVLKEARSELKSAERSVSAAKKAEAKQTKHLTNVEAVLAKTPKDGLAKDAVKSAKAAVKAAQSDIKTATKAVATAEKVVEKAVAGVTKAEAAKLKVEEAKLAS